MCVRRVPDRDAVTTEPEPESEPEPEPESEPESESEPNAGHLGRK